jgi:hypothetical protein
VQEAGKLSGRAQFAQIEKYPYSAFREGGSVDMRKVCVAVLLVIFTVAPELTAQSKTGTIRGTVRDEQRVLFPGVQVTLINVETKATYRTRTNESGEYKLDVPVGVYEVRAELSGFNALKVSNVRVNENESTKMDPLTLTVKNYYIPLQRSVVPIPLDPTPEPFSDRL